MTSEQDYLISLLDVTPLEGDSHVTFINQRTCPFVKYGKDRLTVKYIGKGLQYSDIASIQSTTPATEESFVYYYEAKINDIGQRGDIMIGLAGPDFPLNKHPGLTKKSYGYRSDGKVVNDKASSDTTFSKFNTGDVVGCGINFLKKEIFITHNGVLQGICFKNVPKESYFATVGLHSANESVTFNFGIKEFSFNLKQFIKSEKTEIITVILKQTVQPIETHQIVYNYLNFHGYYGTLAAFERTAQLKNDNLQLLRKKEKFQPNSEEFIGIEKKRKNSEGEEESKRELKKRCQSMNVEVPEREFKNSMIVEKEQNSFDQERNFIRKEILAGKISSAYEFINHTFPTFFTSNSEILTLLKCQEFIEIYKSGNIFEAINFAKENLWNLIDEKINVEKEGKIESITVQNVVGIFCYSEIEKSNLFYLVSEKQKEFVADELNIKLLKFLGYNEKSVLEVALSQLVEIQKKIKEENLLCGERFEFRI